MAKNLTYKKAGVDIDAAEDLIRRIRPFIKKTERPEVLSEVGHYAGLFRVPTGYHEPVLCASTDGVGTKIQLALETGLLDGIGQDLVAMNANDILCLGARPLFFLDYFATGRLEPQKAERIILGVAEACRAVGCTLLGGETAEMPSVYKEGDIDLAGFIVGVVERDKIIDGKAIRPGDTIIGLPSSGPHANGFSLIRKVLPKDSSPHTESLLAPTKLYGPPVLKILEEFPIHGIAHITGGGLWNIGRIVPENCQAVIRADLWGFSPIFHLLKEWGNLSDEEMRRVFNLGIGLVLVVSSGTEIKVIRRLKELGEEAREVGKIEPRPRGEAGFKAC